MSSVIWLDVDADELSVLGDSGESLASVGAEHWCSWEFEVEGADELAGGITEETNTGALVGIKGLAPRVHAGHCQRWTRDVIVGGQTYTKASLTEMTKTLPASLSFAWEM